MDHRFDINRTMRGCGHKYTKYKICLSTTMVMCNIHGKVEQHWDAKLKKALFIKKRVFRKFFLNLILLIMKALFLTFCEPHKKKNIDPIFPKFSFACTLDTKIYFKIFLLIDSNSTIYSFPIKWQVAWHCRLVRTCRCLI